MDRLQRFFLQAEDGIRGYDVTEVQTCALPISRPGAPKLPAEVNFACNAGSPSPACRSRMLQIGRASRRERV